ncbi:peptidase [Phragmitibacter flavus]|uniref:Peptidase n=2 Tax=Phragmitibacter flavus TaxID=2576071 RepID=A0A5R8KIQ8_9BACT|nr:peptidase [Phragmitibacter flavus]
MEPRGIQRGTEAVVTMKGDRLEDFEGLIFYSPGLTVKKVDKVAKNQVDMVIHVAPEVPLGNHMFRLRTKSGISVIRQIFVGPYPNVAEVEPNNDLDTTQLINFNQTIEGVVKTEDVDYFRLQAKKGQRISLEVEGVRLGWTGNNALFDPAISVLNKDRFEIASSDDTILLRQDGYLSVIAPEDGEYFIQIREASYRGSDLAFYRLHVGNFRRPDVVYPSGGKAGSKLNVRFIEGNGESTEQEVQLPAEPTNGFVAFLNENPAPSGNTVRVSAFENYLEVEPNDTMPQANKTAMTAPCAMNGIIEKPGDEDRFMITLKKGTKVEFFAYAQSIGSPLDPVLVVTNVKGAGIGSNDDGGTGRRLDCKLSITAPEDGEYCVIIKDHLSRGGPNYVYRIEAVSAVPELTFSSPHFGVNDSHTRQFITVPRGGYYAILVNAVRNSIAGDMKFAAKNLPPGVTLISDTLPGNFASYPLLFKAEADAPLGGAAVPITLEPTKPEEQKVSGRLAQVFDIVRNGNTVYHTEEVNQLPVAVVEELPFTLEIQKPTVPMVANGVLPLKVVAKRKEGFKAPIRVLMTWKPPGVNSEGEIDIAEGQTEAVFNLDCNANVTPGTYKFTVLGEANGGNGTIYQAAPYCEVVIAPAHLSGTMDLAVVEQGKETTFVCKLEHAVPFEGEAVAELVGIPNGVLAEPARIKKDTNEITFKLKTEPVTPVGKHTTVFCQVQVPAAGGGTTLHRIAVGSTLRVDAPRKAPPPKPAAVADAAKPAPPKPEAPKQLSRLEQLRLEQAGAQ